MASLKELLGKIEPADKKIMEKTQKRLDNLTKPVGSLGRLEDLARRIAGITRDEAPSMKNKVVFVMAGDHGIAEEGISAYPQEVTPQMVYNFLAGVAGINVLARHVGAKVVIVDMGVNADLRSQMTDERGKTIELKIKKINYGTKNFTKGPAMAIQEAERSIMAGFDVFAEENKKMKIDIAGTGDMGIGNTASSSAITAVFTGKDVADVTGRGTGISDEVLAKKIEAIEKGIKINDPDPQNALDILSKIGGFEIGGLAGIMLAGAAAKIPVVIDGFISGAAALIACGLEPRTKDYLIASHCSVEQGHRIILEYLGLKPLLDLDLRLGEGTGAALGINLAEASIRILTEMATFDGAGVAKKVSSN